MVAPEKGQDLNVRQVATRLMKLAEKNSAGFQRQNSKRAEKMQAINGLKTEITELEQTLKAKQHELEAIKVEKESRAIDPIDSPKDKNLDTTEEIRALGIAMIVHVGNENVYVIKDGMPYYFKPVSTDNYAKGEHNFSNDDAYSEAIAPVIEPADEGGDQETNEQTNEQVTPTFTGIDPVAKSNIEAANISAAIKKKAIAYLNANPTSHKIEGISAKSLSAIMENIKTALYAEVKALSPLFSEYAGNTKNDLSLSISNRRDATDQDAGFKYESETFRKNRITISDLGFRIREDKKSPTGYSLNFSFRPDEISQSTLVFDTTTTLEDLRSWGFALPFDLDVKAFVANVIKPVVDEFLSKMQTGETETKQTPLPEPTPLDTEAEAEPIAPIEPVQNETAEIDAEIESLKQLIGMPEFSDALDALLDKLEAAGLDSQYETVVSDIIIQDAQAESAKVGV